MPKTKTKTQYVAVISRDHRGSLIGYANEIVRAQAVMTMLGHRDDFEELEEPIDDYYVTLIATSDDIYNLMDDDIVTFHSELETLEEEGLIAFEEAGVVAVSDWPNVIERIRQLQGEEEE